MSAVVVRLQNVSKFYKLYDAKRERLKEAFDPWRRKRHREFYALRGINLEVKKGEILGVVGRNGAGKSTLLKLIGGVVPASSGQVTIKGMVSALLDLGAGLNPNLDGIQNIVFGGIMLGLPRSEMLRKLDEIVAFADIGDFIHQPMRTYSSGMRARLGFALAVNVNPDILVVDEVLSVGDELFRRKCYAKMEELFRRNCTVIYVTHSTSTVNELCSRAIFLDRGEIVLDGSPKFVTINYDRFLFGNPSEREEIRKELVALNQQKKEDALPHGPAGEFPPGGDSTLYEPSSAGDENQVPNDTPCIHKAVYLPGFQTQSKVIYKTARLELSDLYIATLEGERVNYLYPGEYYSLRFRVRFDEDIDHIVLACVFKTEKGLVLSGVRYPAVGKTLEKVTRDTIFSVHLTFKCSFLPGRYYIDCGVIGFMGNRKQVLAAEYDALAFKVQSCKCMRAKISSWAYFSIEPEMEVRSVSRPESGQEREP